MHKLSKYQSVGKYYFEKKTYAALKYNINERI